jgi:hypothetical protein
MKYIHAAINQNSGYLENSLKQDTTCKIHNTGIRMEAGTQNKKYIAFINI